MQALNIIMKSGLLDEILSQYKEYIGEDFMAYNNHCYRVLNLTMMLQKFDKTEFDKISIAVAFHDLAMWTNNTFDYIVPSLNLAKEYLIKNKKTEWIKEISLMISEHHKIRSYNSENCQLVEAFRKADWIDVSLGMLNFGINRTNIRDIKSRYGNAGFHKLLIRLSIKRFISHPFDPLPMFKW